MKADLHMHTGFSVDSEADMEGCVRKAIDIGMEMICFTDHVDLNRKDSGYHYYNAERYFEKLNYNRQKYGKQIKIGAGIEFGEPHLYPEILSELSKYPYDYIIGSIHWVRDMFPSQELKRKYSVREFFTMYWDEVLKTVKHGGFDALGHIDFPKRYFGELYYTEQKLNEIFQYLLSKDMVLEINTSSLRKGLHETMPGSELLEIYKANGGRYVTVGSDAHEEKDIGADNDAAKELIRKYSLQEVVFENRVKNRFWGC